MSLFCQDLVSSSLPSVRLHRAFRPVGQGAFYTEVFTSADRSNKFVVVYDCGSYNHAERDKQMDDFLVSLGTNPQIDCLFISHFHSDHINGLDRLLSRAKICTAIIPMLPLQILTLTRVQNFLFDKEHAESCDSIIRELYIDPEPKRFGDVILVPPGGYKYVVDDNGYYCSLQCKRKLLNGIWPYNNIWEYEPFNSIDINSQSAIDFMNGLSMIPGAMNNGQLNVDALKWGCRTKVMELYKRVMKHSNDNLYSLVVESRPADGVLPSPSTRSSRCLYFGDFEIKGNSLLWDRFSSVFNIDDIGMIQVPHHGSRNNWKLEMARGASRAYIVSAGTNNQYHHPDYWVIDSIRKARHQVFVVSEDSSSLFDSHFIII